MKSIILFITLIIFNSCISNNESSKNIEIKKNNISNLKNEEIKASNNLESLNHLEHIRKKSNVSKLDGKEYKPKYLVDYIIQNKLESPNYISYITDRSLLRPLTIQSCLDNQILIKDTLLNGKLCEIEIITSEFIEQNHKVIFRKSEDSQGYESIDNKFPYGGLYGEIETEITSINIKINDTLIEINQQLLPSINNPKLCKESMLKSGFEAYEHNENIYIYISGGEAANTYFGKLIFSQSEYVTSILVDYVPLSRYGCFGTNYIGF